MSKSREQQLRSSISLTFHGGSHFRAFWSPSAFGTKATLEVLKVQENQHHAFPMLFEHEEYYLFGEFLDEGLQLHPFPWKSPRQMATFEGPKAAINRLCRPSAGCFLEQQETPMRLKLRSK